MDSADHDYIREQRFIREGGDPALWKPFRNDHEAFWGWANWGKKIPPKYLLTPVGENKKN